MNDIFRGEAADLNQNKQDDFQSARRAISEAILCILGSRKQELHEGSNIKEPFKRLGPGRLLWNSSNPKIKLFGPKQKSKDLRRLCLYLVTAAGGAAGAL